MATDDVRVVSTASGRAAPIWRIVIGALIVGYGVLLMADNLGWAPAYFILDRWYGPCALMLLGVAKFATACSRSGRVFGGTIVTIATLWLVRDVTGFAVGVDFWWPLVIVAGGVWYVMRAFDGRRALPGWSSDFGGSDMSAIAFWSGVHRRIVSAAFSRADFAAVMGGVEIDLRPATTAGGQAVIEVFVLMGGIEITVPPDWAVSNQAIVIMGGVNDNSSGALAAKNTLVIRGLVIMGGIEIKT